MMDLEQEFRSCSLLNLTEAASTLSHDIIVRPSGPWMIPESLPVWINPPKGDMVSVDIGGSTFRVGLVQFPSLKIIHLHTSLIPTEIKDQDIIAWVAHQLEAYQQELLHLMGSVQVPLAVSWAFPLVAGCIQKMGKGFNSKYEGQNLKQVLNSALLANGVSCLQVVSAVQDGTASLIAERLIDPKCLLSITWGTGINISFISEKGPCINTEISMIGKPGYGHGIFGRTTIDDIIDQQVAVPGFQPFETLVGGIYLPEIVRLLTKTNDSIDANELWRILETGGPLYDIVDAVIDRAVRYVAVALIAVAKSAGAVEAVVAYTGGVIFQKVVRDRLEVYLKELGRVGPRIYLRPQLNGPELGAAAVGLVTLRETSMCKPF